MKDISQRTQKPGQTGDVVSLVDELLARAVAAGASDVHFEPVPAGLAVRFRLDGSLRTVEELPKLLAENVITRLKVLAGLLTYRVDVPQEGRIDWTPAAGRLVVDKRLAIFPTIYGQRAVVRLLYDEDGLHELPRLGLPAHIEQTLRQACDGGHGMILFTGPSGSGKSTTMAALLRHILATQPGRSVVTLEDPVERRLDGVTQVQITPHGEMTFQVALRSLLRQDPEVLMIGEIRDAETARIAVEAALTGHLLLSTLHGGTPAAAAIRLIEMGIEPYQVTSSVLAIVNQRLVRRLCERCKRPAGDGRSAPVGCPACLDTGYRGRALIAELLLLDGEVRKSLLAKADLEEFEALASARGHMTLRQSARALAAAGVTTEDELRRVCGVEP